MARHITINVRYTLTADEAAYVLALNTDFDPGRQYGAARIRQLIREQLPYVDLALMSAGHYLESWPDGNDDLGSRQEAAEKLVQRLPEHTRRS